MLVESRASAHPAAYSCRVSITAIVPLKALDRSKQRLAPRLSGEQRRMLMGGMFTHVLRTCAATPQIDDVWAVVGDGAGAALADAAGVRALREPAPGLNPALAHATSSVASTAALVVVADLPDLSPVDLRRVIAAGGSGAGVVVGDTRDGGTGALLRCPPAVIPTAYGPASAGAHLDAARRAGVRAVLVASPGLARDVDRPGDLDRYAGAPRTPPIP